MSYSDPTHVNSIKSPRQSPNLDTSIIGRRNKDLLLTPRPPIRPLRPSNMINLVNPMGSILNADKNPLRPQYITRCSIHSIRVSLLLLLLFPRNKPLLIERNPSIRTSRSNKPSPLTPRNSINR